MTSLTPIFLFLQRGMVRKIKQNANITTSNKPTKETIRKSIDSYTRITRESFVTQICRARFRFNHDSCCCYSIYNSLELSISFNRPSERGKVGNLSSCHCLNQTNNVEVLSSKVEICQFQSFNWDLCRMLDRMKGSRFRAKRWLVQRQKPNGNLEF